MDEDRGSHSLETLSEQERRIAEFLIAGLNTSEIAKRMSLGYREVAETAVAIRARFGVANIAGLRALFPIRGH